MISEYYFKILNVKPDTPFDEIKKSYHRLAKQHHPDMHTVSNRHVQELKMMKINEAYISIMSYIEDGFDSLSYNEQFKNSDLNQEFREESYLPGDLKDPSYTYYKLGFSHYSNALEIFHKRFRLKRRKKSARYVNNENVLKLAVKSIHYFEKSYNYFLRVVNDYPDSIWANDAQLRLNKLSKFNTLYQKICENISSDIKKLQRLRRMGL